MGMKGWDPIVTVAITREWVEQYAMVSGDWNPLHVDPAAALEAGFGGPIAHGMLGMGIMGRVAAPFLAKGMRVKQWETRFLVPLYVGDCLSVYGFEEVSPQGEAGLALRLEGRNQRGQLVLRGRMVLGI